MEYLFPLDSLMFIEILTNLTWMERIPNQARLPIPLAKAHGVVSLLETREEHRVELSITISSYQSQKGSPGTQSWLLK
jgi:hypothetical protein